MRCSNCGAPIGDDAKFCLNCGARIQSDSQNAYNEYNNDEYNNGGYNNGGYSNGGYNNNGYSNGGYNSGGYNNNGYNNGGYSNNNMNYNGGRPPQKTNPLIIVIIILAAIILFITAVLMSNFVMGGGGLFAKATPTPEPTPSPTPEVTEEPAVTPEVIYITPEPQQDPVPPAPQGNAESVVRYPSYSTYNSSGFNFRCNYPSHYQTYNDGLNTSLYTVRAADGNAIEKICAKVNEGETVSGELQKYIDSHKGYVDYKTSGDDYFAVSIVNGTMHSYKYCKFKYGNIYWFEFEYNTVSYADVYDEYINDIYSSFLIY